MVKRNENITLEKMCCFHNFLVKVFITVMRKRHKIQVCMVISEFKTGVNEQMFVSRRQSRVFSTRKHFQNIGLAEKSVLFFSVK